MKAARKSALATMIWCVVATLALTGRGADLPPNASTNALIALGKMSDPDALIGEFTKGKEFVRVSVKIAEPVEKDVVVWNDHASVNAMRGAVRRSGDRVLARTGGPDVKVKHRFENVSGFSAEVSWNALQRILRDNEVVGVELAIPVKRHLAQGLPLMNAMASRSTYDGAGVSVAIVDTGVDYRHPRLGGGGFPNSKVIGGFDVGDNDPDPLPIAAEEGAHGTACAGIAAGNLGTVGDYVGGVAPAAKIYALKITEDNNPFQSSSDDIIAAAWDWCVSHRNDDPNNPIKVISTSFGGGRYFSTCDIFSSLTAAAANAAVAAGITVMVSSGNDGFCDSIGAPACVSAAIPIGAVYDGALGSHLWCLDAGSCVTTRFGLCSIFGDFVTAESSLPDKVTAYSNTSALLGVLAPSDNCYTTDPIGAAGYGPTDYTATFNGTSAACPYAAGAAAALQSAARARLGRFLTPAEIRTKLTTTGDNIFDPKGNITKPRVNLGRAIDSLVATQLFTLTATLISESFTPTNRAVDPNEVVGLNVTIRNVGTLDASNVMAVLVATNEVFLPSAAQNYGTLVANGASVTRNYSFTAGGLCGGSLTNLFMIQAGGSNVGRANVSWSLGSQLTRLAQGFDGATVPALPTNWTTTSLVGNLGWVTTSDRFVTASNSVFAANVPTVGDMVLTSPEFLLGPSGADLAFVHRYDTEYGFDGGVLEISVNGAPFRDIVEAGGIFRTNGYNYFLDRDFGSPLAGRSAWTGRSEGFIPTQVTLPTEAAGRSVRLRWRFASDTHLSAVGWNIDSVTVSDRNCGVVLLPQLVGTRRQGNSVVFSYNSFAGNSYVIEYKDNLASPNWSVLRTESGNNSVRWVTNSMGSNQRFYRLRVR